MFGGSTFGFPTTTPSSVMPATGTYATWNVPTDKAPTPSQLLENIKNAFNPNSEKSAFKHMMYNVVDDPQAYGRPSNVPERLWVEAVQINPDPKRLVPVVASGFQDLKKRIEDQDKTSQAHEKALEDLQRFVTALQRKHELDTTIKIEQYKRRHLELAHRVLAVMKKVEVLRNKGYSITMDEELFRSKMENLQRELNQPTQYKARLNELAALVRMQEDKPAEVIEPLDDESLEAVHSFLVQQTAGIAHLIEIVKKDSRDLALLLDGLSRLDVMT